MKLRLWMIVLFLILLGTTVWALERHNRTVAEAKAEAAEAAAHDAQQAIDSLRVIEDSLTEAYDRDTTTFATALQRWRSLAQRVRGRDTVWDTLPVPVEVIVAVADSTIQACEAAKLTCEARVAIVTERADSAGQQAAYWEEAAKQWKRLARGPFLRPALEITTTLDWKPQGAFDLTLGRSRLKVLGRVEVGEGPESCEYVPQTEGTVCSTALETTGRVGVRYGF